MLKGRGTSYCSQNVIGVNERLKIFDGVIIWYSKPQVTWHIFHILDIILFLLFFFIRNFFPEFLLDTD